MDQSREPEDQRQIRMTLLRNWKMPLIITAAAVLLSLGAWRLYISYAPTPQRQTVRAFVTALAEGDFASQYAMFAPLEIFGPRATPLLSQAAFNAVLTDMGTRYPLPSQRRMELGRMPARCREDGGVFRGTWGCYSEIQWPEPGAQPDETEVKHLAVPLQEAGQDLRVRGFLLYQQYFLREYGGHAMREFENLYLGELKKEGKQIRRRP